MMAIKVQSGLSTSFYLWPPGSRRNLLLPDGEVHVWQANMDELAGHALQLLELLSKDEREKAGRYFFKRDRDYYIIGRSILRLVLSHYSGIQAQQLRFQYGPYGKPGLHESCANETGLQFNLAHSQGVVLLAFGRACEIGVDIEYIRPLLDAEQLAARFFSQRENAMLISLPREQRSAAFFNCWTRKEAYIKALGSGLSQPLDQFSVSLTPGEPACLLHIADRAEEAARWSLKAWTPQRDYVAALAVQRDTIQLHHWRVANNDCQMPSATCLS